MAEHSKIEWTDATWTPIRARLLADTSKVGWHCTHASEGCRNCYAEGMNKRLGTGLPYKPGHIGRDVEMFLDERMLLAPLRWKKARKVFVCSMTDLFADFVPDAWIDRLFAVMALCPQHTFQVLTKRSARMRAWFDRYDAAHDDNRADMVGRALKRMELTRVEYDAARYALVNWPLPNVWLGVSAEDRFNLLARVGDLRMTPAQRRFLSCEPLLGDLGDVLLDGIDWVIVGGESGPAARPMHPDWARSLRDQCAAAGVPFHFKQHGEFVDIEHVGERWNLMSHAERGRQKFVEGKAMVRVGKKAAGRLLDGVEHNGAPA